MSDSMEKSESPQSGSAGPGPKWQPPSVEHLQALLPAYEILSMLGFGGMGAVYKGRQLSLDRTVAIKILPPGALDEDRKYAQRFKNEARTMAKLTHPGIVTVYDFGETAEGQLYFVMEYVDGTDVSKMIQATGKLPQDHALAIIAHVCDALAYAHAHGVVHRDIKPANVLINMQGQVKVADFGLAKIEDPSMTSGLTQSGMAMGTPDFVAPEALLMGVDVDGRADLYAVGVMLYQMLTGEIPRGLFQMPSVKTQGELDPRYDAIITRAMQTNRDLRYQAATEIRKDLDSILTVPRVRANEASHAAAAVPKGAIANVPGQRSVARKPAPKGPPRRGHGAVEAAPEEPVPRPKENRMPPRFFVILGVIGIALFVGAWLLFVQPSNSGEAAPSAAPTQVAGVEQPLPNKGSLATSPSSKPKPPPAKPKTVATVPPEGGVRSAPPSTPKAAKTESATPVPVTMAKADSAPAKATPPAPAEMTPVVNPAPEPAPPVTVPSTIPPDAVSLRLADIEKRFLEAYETKVGAAHKKAVGELNQKLIRALDGKIAAASKAGKLEEAVTLRNEKLSVETHGELLEGDETGPAGDLRKIWHDQMALLIASRDKLAAPMHAGYDRLLADFQDELTKGGKLDDAIRVKAVRDHVAANRESPAPAELQSSPEPRAAITAPVISQGPAVSGKIIIPQAPPLHADKVLPPPPRASPEEILALCEWTLGVKKGSLEIMASGSRRTVEKLEDLPRGKITITGFYVYELSMNEEDGERQWFTMLGRLHELEKIFFHKNPGRVPIEELRGLTKLKELSLAPSSVDDAAFAHLSGLKNLESLSVTYYLRDFNGTGLGYISENLRSLSVNGATLTAEGLAYLPRFRKLERLAISGTAVGADANKTLQDQMLQGLAALPNLESLDLTKTILDGSFLAYLPANSKLKRLELTGMQRFKPENLIHIGKLKNLEYLAFPSCDVPPEAMAAIAKIDTLKQFDFTDNNRFTGEVCKGLKGFAGVREIGLNIAPLSDAGLAAIASAIPTLEHLNLDLDNRNKGGLTPQALSTHLGPLKNFRGMVIAGKGITDEWLPHIAQLKNVSYLGLPYAKITDEGVKQLSKLPLGYFRLDATGVTDAVLATLRTMPTLNNVPVDSTKMTQAGKEELLKLLETNASR